MLTAYTLFREKYAFTNGFKGFRANRGRIWGCFFLAKAENVCFSNGFDRFPGVLFFGQVNCMNPQKPKHFSCYMIHTPATS